MAPACPLALTFFFCCILLLQTICCSGVFLELSYDSTQVKTLSSSVITEYRVMVTDKQLAYLFLKPCRSEPLAAAGSFVNEVLGPNRRLNVSNIIVTATDTQLGALRRTLQSFQASLGDAGLAESVKVSPELSLSSLRIVAKDRARAGKKQWGKVVEFVRRTVDVSSPRRELGEARATAHDEFSPVSNPATTPVSNPVTVPATNPVANPMAPGFVTVPSTNPGNGFATNPNLPPLYPEPTTPTMPPVTVPSPFTNPVAAPTTMPGTVTNPATTPSQFPGTSPVTNPVTTYPYPQQGGVGVGVGGGMPATQPVYQPPATTMPGTGTVQPGAPTVAGQAWCVAKSGIMDTTLQDAIDYACGIGGADCSPIQPMGTCYNPNTLQAHASYAFNSYFQRNPSAASCDFGGAGMLVNVNPSSGTCMYQTSAGFGAGYSPGTTGGGVPSGYTPGMSGTGYNPAGGMSGTMGGGSGSTVLNANNPGGNSMYGGYDNPTGLTAGSAPLSCGGWVVLCLVWMVTFAFVKENCRAQLELLHGIGSHIATCLLLSCVVHMSDLS
ncbi:unnamed protein product [Miscanthus lutarioriparius]|uniref:X8 domain-containing protein n=1 Tax=Miscanthus lutarioriparius TaxID=422564 RepID=A0A811N668_9POAL|nr:unnamed protein product [Miscanthus lutarioriparius]